LALSADKISTIDNPIKYFEFFFSTDYIEEIRQNFFPNPQDPHDFWSDKPISHIDRVEESFEFDYEIVVEWKEDNSIPGYPSLNPVKKEWRTVKKIFKNELDKLFYQEVANSKGLIEKKISLSPTVDAGKVNVAIWVGKLQHLLVVSESDTKYNAYQECSQSIKALIRFLYKSYSQFCPQPVAAIKKIISEKKKQQIIFEKEKLLSPKFYTELIEEFDDDDEYLFEDMTNAKTSILLLAGGSFTKLPEIDFKWKQDAVFYLIGQIRTYNKPKFAFKELLACPNISFRSKRVTENRFSTGKKRFSEKPSRLKQKIDSLVDRHLTIAD